MNELETRLTAELRAESQLITREGIPALSLPGPSVGHAPAMLRRGGARYRSPRRGGPRYGPRRWPGWAAPVAAAAAVVAVIVGTVTASHLLTGGPGQSPATGPSYFHLPGYYAYTVQGDVARWVSKGAPASSSVLGRYIKIRATGTGKLVTTVSPPRPYNDFMVLTGSADGRTFVFGAARYFGYLPHSPNRSGALDPSAPVRFVVLTLGPGGRAHLSALSHPVRILPGQLSSIALSPDGTKLAVAYGGDFRTAVVRVITLATGAARQWEWPHAQWTPVIHQQGAWTADGRTLVVQQWYLTGPDGKTPRQDTPPGTSPLWLIDTAVPSGTPARTRLVLRAPAGMQAPGQPFITPDGRGLVAPVEKLPGGARRQFAAAAGVFAEYSARTGALVRTRGSWTWSGARRDSTERFPAPLIAWSTRDGSELLVIQPRDGLNRLGVLTGNTVSLSGGGLLPSQPKGYRQLQQALQRADGLPPGMAW